MASFAEEDAGDVDPPCDEAAFDCFAEGGDEPVADACAGSDEEAVAEDGLDLDELFGDDDDPGGRADDKPAGDAGDRPDGEPVDRKAGGGPHVSLDVPGGAITWYMSSNLCYAYCDHEDHGGRNACRKVRTMNPGRKMGQGKPLGFLLAWLWAGHEPECRAAGIHSRETHFSHCPSLEQRAGARVYLQGLPAGIVLLQKEGGNPNGDLPEPVEFR